MSDTIDDITVMENAGDDIHNQLDNVIYIRFKNGSNMLATIDDETDDQIIISYAMDLVIIDQGQYSGISLQPTIPYGIHQGITIEKTDILFQMEPNDILGTMYITRSDEAVEILNNYLAQLIQNKKKKAKALH